MDIVEKIIVNTIIMLFPILVYLIYAMYNYNSNKKSKELGFDFALISSLYLLIIYNNYSFILLLNIPLMIAYCWKKRFSIIFISIILIEYYYMDFNHLLYIILNYITLYLISLYCEKTKKKKYLFVYLIVIQCLFFYNLVNFEEIFNTTYIASELLFILMSIMIIIIVKKSTEIINLYDNLKELENEKKFKDSLFKITHEIKNPIAVCKTYLDMFDINNKEHERYIPIIKDEIKKVLILLQDFQCMNKIIINNDVLDINLLIEETVDQIDTISKNCKIKTNLIDDEVFCFGDYNRLSQVLINMIMNSMEANSTNIEIFSEIKDDIIITIKDNGDGFDLKEIDKIKEPFYTTKKNGTGLGVSLSIEIIEAHKGTISYNSKLNMGTTVVIKLPLLKSI